MDFKLPADCVMKKDTTDYEVEEINIAEEFKEKKIDGVTNKLYGFSADSDLEWSTATTWSSDVFVMTHSRRGLHVNLGFSEMSTRIGKDVRRVPCFAVMVHSIDLKHTRHPFRQR